MRARLTSLTGPGGGGGVTPDIHLVVNPMPIDSLLMASIPSPEDHWMRDLALKGNLDISGQVLRNATGDVDIDLLAKLANGRAQPMGGRYSLEKLSLTARIQRKEIELISAEGYHGRTHFNLAGVGARWTGGKPAFNLNLNASSVNLDDPIFDLLPSGETGGEPLQKFMAAHKLQGVLDGRLVYHSQTKDSYQLDLHPEWLSFQYQNRPIELKNVLGHITIDRAGLKLDQLVASLGEGRLAVDGLIDDEGDRADLLLDVQDASLRGQTADLLPAGARKALAGIELDGAYHLHDGHLTYHAKPAKGENLAEFSARVDLVNAKAAVGMAVTDLQAKVDLRAWLAKKGDWPRLDVKIAAPALRVSKRLVAPLAIHLVSVAGVPSELELAELSGLIYGGTLIGAGRKNLERGGEYQMSVALQDVDVGSMLHPPARGAAEQPASEPAHVQATGLMAANLHVQGVMGDSASRRGRGQIEVHNGHLYDLPMAMAMLQLANLSLPTSRSFESASASFILQGPILKFDSIHFDAPTVQIVGDGTMNLPSRQLDLDFFTRNPSGLDLGPLTEMFDLVKDQIISIHVGGTLTEPKVSLLPRAGHWFRKSWEGIFGQSMRIDSAPPTTSKSSFPLHAPLVGVPSTSDQ